MEISDEEVLAGYRDTVEPLILKLVTNRAHEVIDTLTHTEVLVLIVLVQTGISNGIYPVGVSG